MAAVDPIVYAQLCKLFPMLTPKQATNSCLYSIGTNYQDISILLDVTPSAVKKSLESTQKYFNSDSLPDIKTTFWASFVLHQICRKYKIDEEHYRKKSRIDSFLLLENIFPELNSHQLFSAVLYSVGLSVGEIALQSCRTIGQIEHFLSEAVMLLGARTSTLLRALVTSRLVLDLT